LLKIIEQLSYVQLDTISVIERAHNHVLWTRFPNYKNKMLDELLGKDRKVFEYWSHAAAIIPYCDYRYTLRTKNLHKEKYNEWRKKNKKFIDSVYERIKNEGPLQSKDFEGKRKGNGKVAGWWSWKPAKHALELMFLDGILMVAQRKGFQKVYDLTERVVPPGIDTTLQKDEEFYAHLVSNAVKSHGVISDKEMVYLRKNTKPYKETLQKMIEEKKITEVKVHGLKDTYHSSAEKLNLLNRKKAPAGVHILSPFDNLIIQRKRTKAIFGFDFQVEFYLPVHKRKYGYFCLPVLYGDKFVGKIDTKADRAGKALQIISMHWEKGSKQDRDFKDKFTSKLNEFAKFNGCEKIEGMEKIA